MNYLKEIQAAINKHCPNRTMCKDWRNEKGLGGFEYWSVSSGICVAEVMTLKEFGGEEIVLKVAGTAHTVVTIKPQDNAKIHAYWTKGENQYKAELKNS